MRNLLKTIWFRVSGTIIFPLTKLIYTPKNPVSRKFRFVGKFPLYTDKGKRFYLYNNAFGLETNIFWLGINKYDWERMERTIWIECCKSSNSIFDIGSNTGIFSVLAKAHNLRSTVFAFEPQPNIFYVLKKNNEVNKFNIKCENIALSDQQGSMPFYNTGVAAFTTENTTAGSLNKDWRTEKQSSITVSVKKMSDYIVENKIKNIDLIKIDVETFEYEVLLGYGEYLHQHQPIILLEIQNKIIGKNIESLFKNSAYLFYNIDETLGLKQVDELGVFEKNNNYLLCPQSKKHVIEKFIHQ